MYNNEGVCGVLVLDKPQGITSHDAVYKIRRLFGTKKVGHAGTLDPIATGVLVMLIGRATKAAEFVVSGVKRYDARLLLGVTTDTLDIDGRVTATCDAIPGEEQVRAAVVRFTGSYGQVPPMYSAIKKDGAKLVNLARRGITLELEPRPVTVYGIDIERISEREYSLRVECSAGTYIRSLCRDVGAALGCGGTMSTLRRLSSGGFGIDRAHTLEELEKMSDAERAALLLPVESLFYGLPEVVLPEFFAALARSGQPVYQKKIGVTFPEGARVRLADGEGFFAVAESGKLPEGEVLRPLKQFRL